MCGIYGYVGVDSAKAPTLAKALCCLNESRGHHSAGIALVRDDLSTEIVKRDCRPVHFARLSRVNEALSRPHRTLIGHTRWATHGTICTSNAHPFKSGGTIGTHNGVVGNLRGVSEFCGRVCSVDSQYLVYMLDRYGHLGPATGTLNLAWCGRKDAADLRLIRYGNPLHVALCDDGKSLVYSSESRHLRAALAIAGLRGRVEEMPDESSAAVFLRHDGIEFAQGIVPFGAPEEMAQFQYPEEKPVKVWSDYGDAAPRKKIHQQNDDEFDRWSRLEDWSQYLGND